LLLFCSTAAAYDSTPLARDAGVPSAQPSAPLSPDDHTYGGYLRIFIVEPVSRYYSDNAGKPYEFGFLDFAANQSIFLEYGDTIRETINWTTTQFTIAADTIMAIAVVYNGEGHAAWSDPPDGPYTAYYVDAAAGAMNGETDVDDAGGDYTHTVFIEEATSPS
jgi:hypothetical protein